MSYVTELPSKPKKEFWVSSKLLSSVYLDTFLPRKTCHFSNVGSNKNTASGRRDAGSECLETLLDCWCRVTPYSQGNLIIEVVRVKKAEGWRQRLYAIKIISHAPGSLSQSNSLCHFSILSLSEFCLLLDVTEPAVCAFTATCVRCQQSSADREAIWSFLIFDRITGANIGLNQVSSGLPVHTYTRTFSRW